MNKIEVVRCQINGVQVGQIAMTPTGLCVFEYQDEYIKSGVSISPYFLPLKPGLFTAKRDPFSGGFGVFDDSLPDGWGAMLLDRYMRERGEDPQKLTLLQRLSLVGSAGRGALEYFPEETISSGVEFISFDKIATQVAEILNSHNATTSLEELYIYGGSSGGARPKVFAKIDGREWLVKFKAHNDPQDVGETEYRYSLLAKECGISMPETRLFEGKYFGVERYDRSPQGKIHTISAAGLLNANYRDPSLDYSVLLQVCGQLTRDIEQMYDLFRIMVFNVVISNRDDHAKNFSFQLLNNQWQLCPAYDILPSGGFNGYHTTTINNSGEPTLNDILAVGQGAGLAKKRLEETIDEIIEKCRAKNMLKRHIK